MTTVVQPQMWANPGCHNPVPAAKPGHRAKLTCSHRCRKAAGRLHQQEAARRACQERWQVFLPATRRSLERLEVLAGARLADELAEAIQSERARPNMTADLVVERVT